MSYFCLLCRRWRSKMSKLPMAQHHSQLDGKSSIKYTKWAYVQNGMHQILTTPVFQTKLVSTKNIADWHKLTCFLLLRFEVKYHRHCDRASDKKQNENRNQKVHSCQLKNCNLKSKSCVFLLYFPNLKPQSNY